MFTKDKLEKDSNFKNIVSYILHSDTYKLNRFINIYTIEDFIDKLLKANLEEIKYLPKSNLHIYKTSNLGYGYSSNISLAKFNELIKLGKIKRDIIIYLIYQNGNIITYINLNEIDDKLLLTNDIYFIVKKDTKEIYDIIIGKPTNPNYLYYKSNLDGKKLTIDKINLLQNVNRININESIINDFI